MSSPVLRRLVGAMAHQHRCRLVAHPPARVTHNPLESHGSEPVQSGVSCRGMELPASLFGDARVYLERLEHPRRSGSAALVWPVVGKQLLYLQSSPSRKLGSASISAARVRSCAAQLARTLKDSLDHLRRSGGEAGTRLRYFPLLLGTRALWQAARDRPRASALERLKSAAGNSIVSPALASWLEPHLCSRNLVLLVEDDLDVHLEAAAIGSILEALEATRGADEKPPISLIEWSRGLPDEAQSHPLAPCAHAAASCALPGLALSPRERGFLISELRDGDAWRALLDAAWNELSATRDVEERSRRAERVVERVLERLAHEQLRSYNPARARWLNHAPGCPFRDWVKVICQREAKKENEESERADALQHEAIDIFVEVAAKPSPESARRLIDLTQRLVASAELQHPTLVRQALERVHTCCSPQRCAELESMTERSDVFLRALANPGPGAPLLWRGLIAAIARLHSWLGADAGELRALAEQALVTLLGDPCPLLTRLHEFMLPACGGREEINAVEVFRNVAQQFVPRGSAPSTRATAAERLTSALFRVHDVRAGSAFALAPPMPMHCRAVPASRCAMAGRVAACAGLPGPLEAALAGLHVLLHSESGPCRADAALALGDFGDACVLHPVVPVPTSRRGLTVNADARGRPGPWLTEAGLRLLRTNWSLGNHRTFAGHLHGLKESASAVYYLRAREALRNHWSE